MHVHSFFKGSNNNVHTANISSTNIKSKKQLNSEEDIIMHRLDLWIDVCSFKPAVNYVPRIDYELPYATVKRSKSSGDKPFSVCMPWNNLTVPIKQKMSPSPKGKEKCGVLMKVFKKKRRLSKSATDLVSVDDTKEERNSVSSETNMLGIKATRSRSLESLQKLELQLMKIRERSKAVWANINIFRRKSVMQEEKDFISL